MNESARQLTLEDVIELRDRRGGEQKLDLWDPTEEQWDRYGLRKPGEVVSLDAWPPAQRPPRARRADPDSSHEAADALEASGRAEIQMQAVLAGVRRFPGRSSRQLADLLDAPYGLSDDEWYHAIARRLPELRQRGFVVRNGKGGDEGTPAREPGEASRWWPKT